MTRMAGPDCAVMCNLTNTHPHTHTHTPTARTAKRAKREDGQGGHHVTHVRACPGATQVSVRLAHVQGSFDSQLGELVSLRSFIASVYDVDFPV